MPEFTARLSDVNIVIDTNGLAVDQAVDPILRNLLWDNGTENKA